MIEVSAIEVRDSSESGLPVGHGAGGIARWEAAMCEIGRFVSAYITVDNVILALVLAGTGLFSVLAARAQQRLWDKTRHIRCRRRQQQFITEARGHLR